MNEKNDRISAAEENCLCKDTMQREEHDQSDESEKRDQSMEPPRR